MKFEKDIKLVLDKIMLNQLIICVDNAHPNEACGLIFGERNEIQNPDKPSEYSYIFRSLEFNCLESDRKSPISFFVENLDKLNNLYKRAYQEKHLKLVSIFHSHPSGNYPSSVDKKNMKRLNDSNLKSFKNTIWSIMNAKNKDLKAFILFNDEFFQTEVIIKDI